MKIEDIYEPMDVTAGSEERLADAASRMRFNDVGSVTVIDGGALVGILTERDLTRALADAADPHISTVGDYMTPDPAYATPDTDIYEAARMMIAAGFRHLPVLDDRGRLVGIVSIRDIVSELLALVPQRAGAV